MKKYERMTDEQLIGELRGGDQGVMDFVMVKYKSMVRKKARAMYLLGGENEDLIQEGMIGLIKAVRDYNPEQGASFQSFAELCVSRQMYSAIEASKRKKHLPLNSYVSLYESGDAEGNDVPKDRIIELSCTDAYDHVNLLFHDSSPKDSTVAALDTIIQYYKDKGYKFYPLTKDSYICHHSTVN